MGTQAGLAGTIGLLAILAALLPSSGDPLLYPVLFVVVGSSSMSPLPVALIMSLEYLPAVSPSQYEIAEEPLGPPPRQSPKMH